jgi:hypothetical protein
MARKRHKAEEIVSKLRQVDSAASCSLVSMPSATLRMSSFRARFATASMPA